MEPTSSLRSDVAVLAPCSSRRATGAPTPRGVQLISHLVLSSLCSGEPGAQDQCPCGARLSAALAGMSTNMNEPTWLGLCNRHRRRDDSTSRARSPALGWRLRHILERRVALEDKLRDDRIAVYMGILEPFIILFTSDEAWQSDPKNKGRDRFHIAGQKMISPAYRNSGFRLVLMGSDAVVRAYNDLMQFFFERSQQTVPSEADIRQMLALLGTFLRRSAGAWAMRPPSSTTGACSNGSSPTRDGYVASVPANNGLLAPR